MSRGGPVALAALFFLTLGTERADLAADLPARSERVVHYTIEAELVPEQRLVEGKMDLVWRNTSGAPVDHLYFHLYLNAFRDEDSTYLREADQKGKRGSKWSKEYPGSIEVHRMDLADGTNLWTNETRTFVAPDDGNEKDRTLARVQLPAPVAPGDTLALAVQWTSRMPRVLHRTGWAGDPDDPDGMFFMVAQWFPKIAVLRGGPDGKPVWNAHQFHRNTEFFSDYGVYQVTLKVPRGFVVGATGKRLSGPTDNGDGTVTVVHRQEDVHDFAWTASPHFRALEFTWSFDAFCDDDKAGTGERVRALLARTAAHLGVRPEELKPKHKVHVRILYQPDHGGIVDRYRKAAGAALACYGIWFGEYPYDVLTVVDPPAGGMAAGGMEYPTLITVYGDAHAPDYATGMEGVTIHEFGHQFFYGLVGTNEFEEAWLDEGLTSFTSSRVFEEAYGLRTAQTRYGPVHTPWFRPFAAPAVYPRIHHVLGLDGWLGKLPAPWREPDSLVAVPRDNPAWDYLRDMPFLHLDGHVRIPAPDRTRNGWLGSGTQDAMVMPGWEFATRRDYGVNSYGKPTLFLYCLRGLMGETAFDRALHDYATKHRFGHPTTADLLAEIRAQAPEAQKELVDGFCEAMVESAGRVDVAILEASQREVKDGWMWTVRVQRRGAIPVPVEVRVETTGAPEVLATWTSAGRETTRTFHVRRDRKMTAVRLGPDWVRFIDGDVANDARTVGADPDTRPAVVLATRWSLYVEDVVRSYAGLAR